MINCHQMRMTLDHPSRLFIVHLKLEENEMCGNEAMLCNIQFIYLKKHVQNIFSEEIFFFPKSKSFSLEPIIKIIKFYSYLCSNSIFISLYVVEINSLL